jgi:beta-glucanase (GH16 family)
MERGFCPRTVRTVAESTGGWWIVAALCAAVWLISPRQALGDWNIVWGDEFNGSALDTNKWTFYNGDLGDHEVEYLNGSPRNVFVTNGVLHLAAFRQQTNGYNYTSGLVMTTGLFSKVYGRFEFRVKLPMGAAFHPALWMLPANSPYGAWPNAGEIDVMEQPGNQPTEVSGTLHFGNSYAALRSSYNFPPGDSITNFHIYRLDWTTNSMTWLIDGQAYQTQSNWYCNVGSSSGRYPYPAPFDVPFFLIMDLALGGDYVNNPPTNVIDALLPAEMLVDYVRVWDQTPPLAITPARSNGLVVLRWPTNIVCRLQMQTNLAGAISQTGWTDVLEARNPYSLSPGRANALFRLQSP